MKRAIAIFLVFLYTVSVSGMVVKTYCTATEMEQCEEDEAESCCMMMEESACDMEDCCLMKSEVVKVDIPHEKSEALQLVKIDAPLLLLLNPFSITAEAYHAPALSANASPYPPPKIPKRVLLSVFRI